MAHIEKLSNLPSIYVDTAVSLPECNEYVKEVCKFEGGSAIVRMEDTDFLGLVRRKGVPTPRLIVFIFYC